MELGPQTKLDNRNKTTLKKFDFDVMSENCDVIVSFWIVLPIWISPKTGFRTQSLQRLCFQK